VTNLLITKKNAKIQSVQKKIDSLIVRSRVHFEKITSDSDTETDSESDQEELNAKFLEKVIEYYHSSKKFYVEREFKYNSFTNIIRQICKANNITFTSQIKYNESKYNIDYFVYYTSIIS
jgi:hypothetical protein